MSTALVSLMQVKSDDSESPAIRYQRVIDELANVAQGLTEKKPDLIILPELWHGGAFNIDQSVSLATTFAPIAACMAITNCCLGNNSFNFSQSFLPNSWALLL